MEIYKLYNGEVTLTFDPKIHLYEAKIGENKLKVPGVTSIINNLSKPALMYWAANLAAEHFENNLKPGVALDELQIKYLVEDAKKAHTVRKTKAADYGTLAHKWINEFIKGNNPNNPINQHVRNITDAFLDWIDHYKPEFLKTEQVIYSKELNYAGTFDFTAYINSELYMGDIKTSNAFYPEMHFQTAAYVNAREEEYQDETYSGRVIIRCGKDGSFDVYKTLDQEDYLDDLNAFKGLLSVHSRLVAIRDSNYARTRTETSWGAKTAN